MAKTKNSTSSVSKVKATDTAPLLDKEMEQPDIDNDFKIIEETPIIEEPVMQKPNVPQQPVVRKKTEKFINDDNKPKIINCLRDEIITIKYIPQDTGFDIDPKSPVSKGKADTSEDRLVVPWNKDSTHLVDPLTDEEKVFFEHYLQLEEGAFSIYRHPCYWSSSTKNAINYLILTKDDTHLNLADAHDYLRYKIALVNSEIVCPSRKLLLTHKSQTYRYVIVSSSEEKDQIHSSAHKRLECNKLLMNYSNDKEVLLTVLKTIEGKRMAPNTDIDIALGKLQDYIYQNPDAAYEALKDPQIRIKTLIDIAIRKKVITKYNGIYRDDESKQILAAEGQSSTYNTAIEFLSDPENGDLKTRISELIKD